MSKLSVLFVCTGNSARSIIAEALAAQRYGLEARSAGSDPKPEPHPLTLETLKKHGLSIDGLHSKSCEEFLDQKFDMLITVCDSAKESCPQFPGAGARVHWHMPDPPAAERPEDMFEAVMEALDEATGLLANGPDPDPKRRATEAARVLSRRWSPKMV